VIRRVLAEAVGSAFLVAAVVGSGIMATRLSPNDVGLQLLENAVATAAALVAIIIAVGPVSGAHLNPVITLVDLALGGLRPRLALGYIVAQVVGGGIGAVIANLMYGLAPVRLSSHARTGADLWLAEVIATVGLVLVVFGAVRSGRSSVAPFAVGAYIGGAYFFTSSTSFANPAVTLARTLTDTFAGIAPSSAPAFIGAQLVGGAVGLALVRALYPRIGAVADATVVPRVR
jgi:glycerol uptake facilitator-like aquaporin